MAVCFWRIVFVWLVLRIRSTKTAVDNEFERVPPIHQMDDFLECREKGNIFCRIQFTLRPRNLQSTAWQIIQKTKENPNTFNGDIVYRFRCFPNSLHGSREDLIGNATIRENRLLQNFSLMARVDDISCRNYSEEAILTHYDYGLLYVTLAWLGIIAAATLGDIIARTGYFGGVLRYTKTLSMLSNWDELRSPLTNPDYQRLKGLQGIRTYNMAIVILGHTIFNALFSFTSDTHYVEDFYKTSFKKFGLNFGLHIVQTNFVISGWLLASQMYSYMEKHKKLSIRLVLKWILQRYLRLFPVLAFIICWQMSNWTNALAAPPPAERNEMDFKACQKNWWATLLLVNNFWKQNEMCNLGTWYLSNDFQMFILAMIFFYLMVNYNVGEEIIFYAMSFFWTVHAYLISTNNFGVIFNFTPENAKVENSVASYLLYVLYTAFYGNFGSYGIGLLFGGLFHKYKNHVVKANEFLTYSWLLIFFGFPISAVYLSMFEYPRLISGLVGASLKPIFSLGIAVGMLGMSHGIGGIIKSICEWNFLVFLAKWTYCTYLVHFGIVFGRYLIYTDVIHISDAILTKSVITDLIQSFAAGLVLHLLVERPITHILKKILNVSTAAKIKSR